MSSFKETLEDIRTYRSLLEENATREVLAQVKPRLKAYIDAKLNGEDARIDEQQIGVVGPGGFPYQNSQVTQGNTLAPDEQSTVVAQPVVSVDSVAVPNPNGTGAAVTPVIATMPVEAPSTGVVLDLDAIEAEATAAAAMPEVPTVTPPVAPISPVAPDAVVEPSGSEVVASAEAAGTDTNAFDEDLIQVMDPEQLVNGGEEESDDLEIEFDEEDEEEDSSDYITIEPASESPAAKDRYDRRASHFESVVDVTGVTLAEINSHLSRVENLYTRIVETDDLFARMNQFETIQETLRENQTLRDAIKRALTAGTVGADAFKGLYEISLNIERDLRTKAAIYESTDIELVEDDAPLVTDKANPKTETNDVIADFGGGHVANAKVVQANPQTGPMKADTVVYELDMAKGAIPTSVHKTTTSLEETAMAGKTRNDEYIEIDREELAEALKRQFAKRKIRENAQAEAGDPGTPPTPRTKSGLGDSDASANLEDVMGDSMVPDDGTVEADGYAATSDGKKTPPAFESLKRENAQLRKDLAEAKLVNRKLVHAFKLSQIKGLTNEQKQSISKRLKEAKTIREADLVAETIKEQFEGQGNSNAMNEARVRTGASSRVTPSGAPSRKPLTEGAGSNGGADQFARWNQLAGVRK